MKQLFKKLYRWINPPKEPEYPCKKCMLIILNEGCSSLCDQVEMDDDKLRKHVLKFKCCPDCGCNVVQEGPSGGLSQNIKCMCCHHKFNNALPLLFQRI